MSNYNSYVNAVIWKEDMIGDVRATVGFHPNKGTGWVNITLIAGSTEAMMETLDKAFPNWVDVDQSMARRAA